MTGRPDKQGNRKGNSEKHQIEILKHQEKEILFFLTLEYLTRETQWSNLMTNIALGK